MFYYYCYLKNMFKVYTKPTIDEIEIATWRMAAGAPALDKVFKGA